MRAGGLAIALLLAAALAGCIGDEESSTTDGISVSEASAEARAPPTLDGPPDWRVGDWWTLRLAHPLTGEEHIVTQVVAEVKDGAALIGLTEPPTRELMVLETPLWGEVQLNASGISTGLRETGFQHVQFPLEEGLSWETEVIGGTYTAHVEAVESHRAVIRYVWTGETHVPDQQGVIGVEERGGSAVYDASAGMLISLIPTHTRHVQALTGWEVLGHGADHEGPVYVPADRKVMFDESWWSTRDTPRADVAADYLGQAVGPIAQRNVAQVPEGFTDLSFVLAAGTDGVPSATEAGAVHVHIYHHHPETGEELESRHVDRAPGNENNGMRVVFQTSYAPAGQWTVYIEDAVGVSQVLGKGVAYTLVTYDTPGGTPEVLG